MKLVKYEAKSMAAIALIALVSPAVMASEPGWYVGGDVGRAIVTIDDNNIIESLAYSGYVTTSMSQDEHETAYKLLGGYQFNKYFALEAGYFNLGKFSFDANTVPAGSLRGNMKVEGLGFDAVGILPFTEKLSAFGRAGITYIQTRDSFQGSGAVVAQDNSASDNDANYKFGLGLQYDFTESFAMRLEGERYRISDAVDSNGDADVLSIGAIYRFGQSRKSSKSEPAPVASKPAPAPAAAPVAAVVVPVRVKTDEYCSVLAIEYEINQGAIQDQEKEKLAVLGRFMTKYPDTTAVIEGHTDDVGTAKHNQKLSQERADSVVQYLVDKQRIDVSRLKAVGYGEENPQNSNADRLGKQSNRRINAVIACATDVEGLAVAYPRITMAMEMDFDPYKSNIEPKYYADLNKVADYMMTHPNITATVEGHAGKYVGTGNNKVEASKELSMDISAQRATKVVDYLVSKGVSRNRVTAAAYGQTRRVSYGTTLDGQQENRRVNIIFNYPNSK